MWSKRTKNAVLPKKHEERESSKGNSVQLVCLSEQVHGDVLSAGAGSQDAMRFACALSMCAAASSIAMARNIITTVARGSQIEQLNRAPTRRTNNKIYMIGQ